MSHNKSSDEQPISILVTGGTGMLGANVLEQLTRKGFSVRATKRPTSSFKLIHKVFERSAENPIEQFSRIEWVEADLLNAEQMLNATRNIQLVFHAGAMVSFSPKNSKEIIQTNQQGTANLVDACIANDVKEICYVSSIAALGKAKNGEAIDETCAWEGDKGQGAYAISKHRGEIEVMRALEHGIRLNIVCPSIILGPDQLDGVSGQIISLVSKGLPIYTNGIIGYVDARDVAKIMIKLMLETDLNGERFIANAEDITFRQTFEIMAELLEKRKPFIRIYPWMSYLSYPFILLFGFLIGKGAFISFSNMMFIFNKSKYSNKKVRQMLDFQFTSVEESLRFSIKP